VHGILRMLLFPSEPNNTLERTGLSYPALPIIFGPAAQRKR
jgi:hypothetical protein